MVNSLSTLEDTVFVAAGEVCDEPEGLSIFVDSLSAALDSILAACTRSSTILNQINYNLFTKMRENPFSFTLTPHVINSNQSESKKINCFISSEICFLVNF